MIEVLGGAALSIVAAQDSFKTLTDTLEAVAWRDGHPKKAFCLVAYHFSHCCCAGCLLRTFDSAIYCKASN